jgi:hypothetical protein
VNTGTETNLTLNGVSLHVLDEGDGAPVLLLHAFPDSADPRARPGWSPSDRARPARLRRLRPARKGGAARGCDPGRRRPGHPRHSRRRPSRRRRARLGRGNRLGTGSCGSRAGHPARRPLGRSPRELLHRHARLGSFIQLTTPYSRSWRSKPRLWTRESSHCAFLSQAEDFQVAVGGTLLCSSLLGRLCRSPSAVEGDACTCQATAAELMTDARATASTVRK